MRMDPRGYVVAELSEVSNPVGQWQLRAQVLHRPGETWRGSDKPVRTLWPADTAVLDAPLCNAYLGSCP